MTMRFDDNYWGCDAQYDIVMGKGSGGGSTTTSSSSPPPQVMQQYQNVINQANTTAGTPLNLYSGQMVAPFTGAQNAAFDTINNAQGIATPYLNQATYNLGQSTGNLWNSAQQFSPQAIQQYMNPYTQQVVDSTRANLQENDAQQQNQLRGNAIASGAFGGDRAGVASAELSRQQNLADNQTISGLYNQAYNTGLSTFQQQQQAQLGANAQTAALNQNAANMYSGLGTTALNNALTGANAQLGAGTLQQQLGQAALNVPYQQYQQQQAYPFQTTQWLANTSLGLGSGMGGTSSTTQPSPDTGSQVLGNVLGIAGTAASIFSDERLKENIRHVGTYKDRYPLYTYNYIGDKTPQVGVIAQDVEGIKPSAVGEQDGYKTVDYNKLWRGGIAGYADGGSANQFNIPDMSLSLVPTANAMSGASGLPQPPQVMGQQSNANPLSGLGGMASSMKGLKGLFHGDNVLQNLMSGNAILNPGATAGMSDMSVDLPSLGFNYANGGIAGYADGGAFPSDNPNNYDDVPSAFPLNSMGDNPFNVPDIAHSIVPENIGLAAAAQAQQQMPASLPDAPVPNMPQASQPQSGDASFQPDPGLALASAGFGMAGNGSPYFGVNFGRGALAGIANWQQQKQQDFAAKKLMEQIAMAQARLNTSNKSIKQDAMGNFYSIDKTTGQMTKVNSDGVAASGKETSIPTKAAQVFADYSLPTTPPPLTDKDQQKTNNEDYKTATDANGAARQAAASVAQIIPALQDYQGGMGSTWLAGLNAALPEGMQNKQLINTQEINKKSGEIASELATKMKGARIGIGMERFIKSTTIDPANSKEANMFIVHNIMDMPSLTQTNAQLMAYTKALPADHRQAIIDSFYNENPMMIPASSADPKAPDDLSMVNPKYRDPHFFSNWINGKDTGVPAPQPTGAGTSVPSQPPQQPPAVQGTGKIVSAARVEALAKKLGKSSQEAKDALLKQGYQVQ